MLIKNLFINHLLNSAYWIGFYNETAIRKKNSAELQIY